MLVAALLAGCASAPPLPEPVSPGGLAPLADGRLLVGDSGVGRLWILDRDLEQRTPLPATDREPTEPEGMAVAPDGGIYVADLLRRDLSRVDPERGTREVVSGPSRGEGPLFDTPQDVAVAPDGSLWVADPGWPGVGRVDPATGARTLVEGGGPAWGEPFSLEFAPDGFLYVTDLRLSAVLRVDPATGRRSVVASARRGRGPRLDTPTCLLPLGDRLLVGDIALRSLFSVDPASGDRTLISGPRRGSGPDLREPMSLVLEGPDRVLAGDAGLGAVVRVDLETGQRTASPTVTGGSVSDYEAICASPEGEVWTLRDHGRRVERILPAPPRPIEARVDLDEPLILAVVGSRLLLGDRGDNSFLVLDPERGTGRKVPDVSCGHAPAMAALGDGRVAYYDGLADAVFDMDPVSGARRVWSGPDHPGPPLDMPVQMVASGRELYLVDETSAAVLEIRANGARRVLSGAGRGTGRPFLYPDGLGILPDGDLCVSDQGQRRLLRVDRRTGDRSPLFPEGEEPTLPSPGPLVVLADGRIVVLDQDLGPVLLDPAGGEPRLLARTP